MDFPSSLAWARQIEIGAYQRTASERRQDAALPGLLTGDGLADSRV